MHHTSSTLDFYAPNAILLIAADGYYKQRRFSVHWRPVYKKGPNTRIYLRKKVAKQINLYM
jgi:hypothetical protein